MRCLIRNITVFWSCSSAFSFLQTRIIIQPSLSSLIKRADKISRMKTASSIESTVANRTRLECGTAAWRRPPWSVRPLLCLILTRIALSGLKIITIMRLAIRWQGKNHPDKWAKIVLSNQRAVPRCDVDLPCYLHYRRNDVQYVKFSLLIQKIL